MKSLSNESPYEQVAEDPSLSLSQAGCLLLILSPLIALVGGMRWNIKATLDADLAAILTWFCNSALLFLLLLPMASTRFKGKLLTRIFTLVSTKLYLTVQIFRIFALIAFVIATLISFHYLIGEFYFFVFGQR